MATGFSARKRKTPFRRSLASALQKSLLACRSSGQKLVIQEVGGYVVELLHERFQDQLDLVEGVVEITKQGVWRADQLASSKFPSCIVRTAS